MKKSVGKLALSCMISKSQNNEIDLDYREINRNILFTIPTICLNIDQIIKSTHIFDF